MRDYEHAQPNLSQACSRSRRTRSSRGIWYAARSASNSRCSMPRRCLQKPYNSMQRLVVLLGRPDRRPCARPGARCVPDGYRDSSFKTEADVERLLTLPVLALVPISDVRARTAWRRRRVRVLVDVGGSAVVLLVGCSAASSGGCGRKAASTDVPDILRPSRAAVRAHTEPEVPVHDAAASGGAEQSCSTACSRPRR